MDAHSHTHTLTLSHTHAHIHSHTHSHTHTLSHTHTHSHAHTLTHTHSVLFRLYWFPTKVIYSAMYVSVVYYPGAPFWLLFTIMLWALWGMQASQAAIRRESRTQGSLYAALEGHCMYPPIVIMYPPIGPTCKCTVGPVLIVIIANAIFFDARKN